MIFAFIFFTVIALFVAYMVIDQRKNPSPWSWNVCEQRNGYIVKRIQREEMGFMDWWEYRIIKNGKTVLTTTDYAEVEQVIAANE